MDWTELETSTHQDHVIKHVLGATVLGWLIVGEAVQFLLDIGFLWTVYVDGEMNLLPQGVAIAELEADDLTGIDRAELALDAQQLLAEGREVAGLKRFTAATVDCLITSVELFSSDSRRRIVVIGESANLEIETSLESFEITISSHVTV